MIESSYPNAISLADVVSMTGSLPEEVHFHLQELISKNLVKPMDGAGGLLVYTRVTENDTEIKMVKQMPKVMRSQQPTIAIITAQFAEKLAVDAMIDNKDTYVRYKTEGESNVYTLGNIGQHRVVSTKLPSMTGGSSMRDTLIASGNSTTRLLGTFQRVDYVFLVGVGGGVPHFTDYSKHVRLGDVVVSSIPSEVPTNTKPYIYLHGGRNHDHHRDQEEDVTSDSFSLKTWCPPDLECEIIARAVYEAGLQKQSMRSWEYFIREGLESLSHHSNNQELDLTGSNFTRPSDETDKLFMSVGCKDVIEVGHPSPPQDSPLFNARARGFPVVHFGPIGSGASLVRDEVIRQDVASRFGIRAFDSEFDSVLESIFGNRKEKYCVIRGIADYKDGLRGRKEWIPYASLAAASFMKSVILNLPVDGETEV
jgi:nucleoside phosphorylase